MGAAKKVEERKVQEKPPFDTVNEGGALLIVGKLHFGFSLKGEKHFDFAMRFATTADMYAAEQTTPPGFPLAFNGEVMCRQLVRIGPFTGPFTNSMLGTLRPVDYAILRSAQQYSDTLGEG